MTLRVEGHGAKVCRARPSARLPTARRITVRCAPEQPRAIEAVPPGALATSAGMGLLQCSADNSRAARSMSSRPRLTTRPTGEGEPSPASTNTGLGYRRISALL